jgi:hypothetical protein
VKKTKKTRIKKRARTRTLTWLDAGQCNTSSTLFPLSFQDLSEAIKSEEIRGAPRTYAQLVAALDRALPKMRIAESHIIHKGELRHGAVHFAARGNLKPLLENVSYDGYCWCFQRIALHDFFTRGFGDLWKLSNGVRRQSLISTTRWLWWWLWWWWWCRFVLEWVLKFWCCFSDHFPRSSLFWGWNRR